MTTDLFTAVPPPDAATVGRLHERLVAMADAEDLLDVAYRTVDSPLGPLLVAATPAGLVRVAFPSEGHDAVLGALATTVSPRVLAAPARLDATARQLDEYFAGRRRHFDVPVDLQLAHGFRRSVLEHLRAIEYGATETYAQVATRGRQPARRAGGRQRLRDQPGAGRRPVPPRGAHRRLDRWLPRRAGGQADAPRVGGRVIPVCVSTQWPATDVC